MATGYTNAISNDDGLTSQIRLYYSSTFHAATSTSTVTVTPQLSAGNLGNDIRAFSGGVSNAGVYGGSSSSTSNLYSLSANYGSGQFLKTSSTSWGSLSPQSGSISTFTVKHGKDGKATFYGGFVGMIITMYDQSTSRYQNITGNKNGCHATITVSAPYTISYNANGGSGAPVSQSVFATYSYEISTTVPTRSNYNFLGWATSSSATEAEYLPGESVVISGNLQLYAVWSQTSKTVFLLAGENVEEVIGAGTYTTGQSVACYAVLGKDPNYTYTFEGWYNNSVFVSSENPYTFTMGNSNLTLEARATKVKIDIPGISSITTPDGDTYAIKDAYARELIESLAPLNKIYPVGSIYMSVANISPAVLFGGTWEQIQDVFLLAAGQTYTAGITGGEATHTLTVNEMPEHEHDGIYWGVNYKDTPYPWGLNNDSVGNGFSTTYSSTRGGPDDTHAMYTGASGGGQAHNNMPPYLSVYMWKRVA